MGSLIIAVEFENFLSIAGGSSATLSTLSKYTPFVEI
jgi:hypothetical protein